MTGGSNTLEAPRRHTEHIAGLDSIRFVCAAIVALGHYPIERGRYFTSFGAMPAQLIDGALGVVFNGPAAVIVFFVLSGLVIHRPYARGKQFDLRQFYTRRYFRILPPLVAFVILYALVVGVPDTWNNTVIWSVICEVIYYLIYPAIRLINFTRWALVLGAAVLAIGLAGLNILEAGYNAYTVFGYWTWLIGLPCWLAGCAIAEHLDGEATVSRHEIWSWRAGIWAVSTLLLIAKFHAGTPLASYVLTLTLFAIPVSLWIWKETRYFADRKAPWLDRLGSASYSIYLVHALVLNALILSRWNSSLAYVVGIGAATTALYYAVERPSHMIARFLARRAN